ncbi:MAG: CHAT domain-containing protein [Brasilonema octagenarum HA4186-MV1]|jgi:WD40 repeat protein/energy-coupling factor transporter ATP-binding protein EcfA2|nr:CHAT domain-containing protein [Brasilonema octagenarum HA4186-MV1]
MNIFEITIQRKYKDSWFVIVEHNRPGQLPIRSEGTLKLKPNNEGIFDELGELLWNPTTEYGEMLGKALFYEEVRDAFAKAVATISDRDTSTSDDPNCLHILLHIEDEELRQLRWEKLCVPWDGGYWDYLLLNQKTPLSLYIPSTTNNSFPAFGRRDLQALVVAASPEGLGSIHLAPFDVQATVSSIKASLGDTPCDVLATGTDKLPTLANLMQCLANNEKYYNVLHLVCHGQLLANGETAIYLTDESNQVARVKVTELIRQLRRSRRLPHFAFLSTCESASAEAEVTKIDEAKQAQIGEVQAIGGLAQRLVRELSMPAVVAMTEAISIKTAEALAATFYKQLRQHGYVDLALVEATAGLQGRYDITVPALFSRLGGRPLFSDTLDRPLTKKEIEFGLEELQKLLSDRAPMLENVLKNHIATLEQTLTADSKAGIQEQKQALEEIDTISLEVLDLSFQNLALGKEVRSYDARCPFRGLYPFRYEDREFFCGRGELIEELQQKLSENNFLPVLGASGSGKSSVVMAGLIPSLQQKETQLVMAYMTPNVDPLGQLATSLAQVQNQPYILVVDQFEEVFTLCNEKDKRQNFIDELLKLAQNQRVILTMRADFWGECATYPELRDLMEKQQKLIAPMNTAELRKAIDEQAAKVKVGVGLRFEVDLLNKILDHLEGEPGAMPLLQHALLELWKRRHGRWLLWQEYRNTGGVQKSIAKTADDFYNKLSSEEKDLARHIFVSLTRLDENAVQGEKRRDTRQHVELKRLISADSDADIIKNLVNRLADERLVITSFNEATKEEEVEVAHEALIRYWLRLSSWLDEDRGSLLLRQRIEQEAREWENAGKKEDLLLLQGSRLTEAVELLSEDSRVSLSELGRNYVVGCQQLQEKKDVSTKTQLINAWSALSEVCLFRNEQLEALIYALKAGKLLQKIQESPWLEKNLITSTVVLLYHNFNKVRECNRLKGHQGEVISVSFSPNGKLIATASYDTTAKLWDITGQQVALLQHQGEVNTVSFSPDGKLIATASRDGTAKLWNIAGQQVALLQHQGEVNTVSFSPDNKFVVTASYDTTAKLWDMTGQQIAFLQHQKPIDSVSFSPDGKLIATGSRDSTAKLWDMTGQQIALLQHQKPIDSVSFSPDGKLIATGSRDSTAKLWDMTGQQIAQLQHQNWVNSISFSPDGKLVATGSRDGTAKLWDIAGQQVTLFQHQGEVNTVSFSPNGKLIATASRDGTAKLWNIAGQQVAQLQHQNWVNSISFSPDGKLVATASRDQTVKLWKIDAGQQVAQLQHQDYVKSVSFSPDGKLVATASRDGTAKLWDITGQQVAQLQHQDYVKSVSFSPDGKLVATASRDGTAKLWDITGQQVAQLQHQREVTSVSFSPNGKLIATTSRNGAKLWDITGQQVTLLQHQREVTSVSFSPDSKLVATASCDKTAKLWDITGQQIALLQHQREVTSVSFSLDSKLVATASCDKTAKLWDITGQQIALLQHQDYVKSVSFSPNGKLVATASRDKTAKLWEITGQQVALLQHQDYVNFVTFSPNGKLVATAVYHNHTVKLWDITGQQVALLPGQPDVIFSPDGKLVATNSFNRTVTLWQVGWLDELLEHGCDRIRDYLTHSPGISESDHRLIFDGEF